MRIVPSPLQLSQRPPLTLKENLPLAGNATFDSGVSQELPNVIKDSGVCRGVGPRRAANGCLVNVHYLVELLESFDPDVPARNPLCPLSLFART